MANLMPKRSFDLEWANASIHKRPVASGEALEVRTIQGEGEGYGLVRLARGVPHRETQSQCTFCSPQRDTVNFHCTLGTSDGKAI